MREDISVESARKKVKGDCKNIQIKMEGNQAGIIQKVVSRERKNST